MGEAMERLIALSSAALEASLRERSDVSRVSAYTRQQNGRTVHVSGYTRVVSDMSADEITSEIEALRKPSTGMSESQRRSRFTLLMREVAERQRVGLWKSHRVPGDQFGSDPLVQRGAVPEVSYPFGHSKAPAGTKPVVRGPQIAYPPGHSKYVALSGEAAAIIDGYVSLSREI